MVLLRTFAARKATFNLRLLATRVANHTMPKGLSVKKKKQQINHSENTNVII